MQRAISRLAVLRGQLTTPVASGYSSFRLFSGISKAETDSQSVACLIIGDEILNGKTQDTNSNYLAKKCFDFGLDLRRIQVVPDVEQDIIESVRELSRRYHWVFTSGGIGPTHDDITYQSIAKAFDLPLAYHEPTLEKMRTIMPLTLVDNKSRTNPPPLVMTEARKRMALLPVDPNGEERARVVFPSTQLWVPLVIVNENVHILPGVPKLFRILIDRYFETHVRPTLSLSSYSRVLIGTSLFEGDIAPILTDLQEKVQSEGIKIGSYPRWRPSGVPVDEWNVRVVVSLLGRDKEALDKWGKVVVQKIQGVYVENTDTE
ncbi:hypothetical protein SpCBS45565_g03333 [Spizellomyces sp. 'palustris']|nr:hypothetical protein SpCBS45565_g03333 [Spizellomyces sp. 'palustris']